MKSFSDGNYGRHELPVQRRSAYIDAAHKALHPEIPIEECTKCGREPFVYNRAPRIAAPQWIHDLEARLRKRGQIEGCVDE